MAADTLSARQNVAREAAGKLRALQHQHRELFDVAAPAPERLRQEIRAIKTSGLKGFCIAGGAEFLKDQGLSDMLSQELGGTAHLHPAGATAR